MAEQEVTLHMIGLSLRASTKLLTFNKLFQNLLFRRSNMKLFDFLPPSPKACTACGYSENSDFPGIVAIAKEIANNAFFTDTGKVKTA